MDSLNEQYYLENYFIYKNNFNYLGIRNEHFHLQNSPYFLIN